MPRQVKQIRVFVSCPHDVDEEAKIVEEVCKNISVALLKERNIEVKVIYWKNDIIPLITGEEAQAVVDRQLEEYEYDIYVGILWKRFGEKQSNGLTPTEKEFEDALRQSQKTRKPIVQFYFKLDENYPFDSNKTQFEEVQKFKERIKHLGLYEDFKGKLEFQKKVHRNILYAVLNYTYLTSPKIFISKIKYDAIPDYLSRKVYPAKDYSLTDMLFLRNQHSQDLVKLVLQSDRIVLLGDAGVGKTTELLRIAWHFSNYDSPFCPFFMSLNKYVNQKISDLLPLGWSEIPEQQLLVILDGLDEIESKNKNDAIRQIEFFSEQYPECRIIVSCRTNFYDSETKKSSGTLREFSSYILLDLEEKEIEEYVRKKLR